MTDKEKVQKFFKSFKWYELTTFIVSLIVVVVLSICFRSSWLTIILSISGIIYVFLLAKRYKISMVFGIIQSVLYIIQSALYKNWGEFAINIIIVFPLILISLISWEKQNSNVQVESKSMSKKEILIAIIIDLLISIMFYFILRKFNTNYLIFATLSVFSTTLANYLMLRKSVFMFLMFTVTNILMLLIWLMPIFEGISANFETIPMLAQLIVYALLNLFGIINWKKNKTSVQNNSEHNVKNNN